MKKIFYNLIHDVHLQIRSNIAKKTKSFSLQKARIVVKNSVLDQVRPIDRAIVQIFWESLWNNGQL